MALSLTLCLALLALTVHGVQVRPDINSTTPPEIVDGYRMFQGDILLNEAQWTAMLERKAVIDENFRWPSGTDGRPLVPYTIALSDFDVNTITMIESALTHWRENTCINFDFTINPVPNSNYLVFKDEGPGICKSFFGRQQQILDGQSISLGAGCQIFPTAVHEIGHAIGFVHELSRTDRDEYVVVQFGNIDPNRLGEYNILDYADDFGVPYDYGSIMGYDAKEFSKNGLPTLTPKDPTKYYLLGTSVGLTFRDAKLANIIYNCTGRWLDQCSLPADYCDNEGYVGKNCTCWCPPGTSGSRCQTDTGDYYGEPTDSCTEVITSPGTITSPNNTNGAPAGLQCAKVIQAPPCHLPQLTFTSFTLPARTNNACILDSLEVRLDYPEISVDYCGQEITPGTVFTGTSQEMVIVYITTQANSVWSADVAFVPDLTCSTTTTPAPAYCSVEQYNGVYYWSSPNFGVTNYPNNFKCGITATSREDMVTVKVVYQSLELPICPDYLKIYHLYGRSTGFCGLQNNNTVVFRGPSFNFRMEFVTDGANTFPGFNISLIPGPYSKIDCHRTITLKNNRRKMAVLTPDYKRQNYKRYPELFCEYRFVAPEGKQIRVLKLLTKIQKDKSNCYSNFLLLNDNKESRYPVGDHTRLYCGWQKEKPFTTATNELSLAYQKTYMNRSRGFFILVKVV